jgi:hypothetical protein
MYAQRITNDQIEIAYNMAQQVEVEAAFRRLLSKSEES